MTLPTEIQSLNLQYLKRVSDYEYSAACPKCGGFQHSNGDYPDRFRIWIKSRVTGGLLGWCRQCGYVWSPRGEKFTPEQRRSWEEEQKQAEIERQAKLTRALDLLRSGRAWERYHDNLNAELRDHYYQRGIPDFWIDYWMLGYNPQKTIWDKDIEHVTAALTIPIYLPGVDDPISIRNRLLNPIRADDKYRPEITGLQAALYFTDKENKPSGRVLVVEGEFKAMTTYIKLDTPGLFVVGIPGKRPSIELFEALDQCDLVYLLLDPDAYVKTGNDKVSPIRRLIEHFGERARVIQTPYKVDDMLLSGALDKNGLFHLIKDARRYKQHAKDRVI